MAEQHSSKSIMWAVIGIAIVLIAIVYPLTVKQSTSAADAAGGNDEDDVRIQPVAKFELAKAAYRVVLHGEPQHMSARYNLERALRRAPEVEPPNEAEVEQPPPAERSVTTMQVETQGLP